MEANKKQSLAIKAAIGGGFALVIIAIVIMLTLLANTEDKDKEIARTVQTEQVNEVKENVGYGINIGNIENIENVNILNTGKEKDEKTD